MHTSRWHPTVLFLTLILAIAVAIPLGAAEPEPDRIFVVVSPQGDPGPSAVVVFDVDAGGGLVQGDTYATGGQGNSWLSPQTTVIDPLRRLLFVPNNESADISVFSIGTDGLLSPVPGSPFPTGPTPATMALHPGGDWLYVNNFSIGVISVHAVLPSGELALKQTVLAGFPSNMEVHPSGGVLYVGDFLSGVRAFAIGADGALSELGGSPYAYMSGRPYDLEIDSRGRRLWVLDLDEGIAVFGIAADGGLVAEVDPPVFVSDFTESFLLTDNDAHVYATEGGTTTMHAYNVRGSGRPRTLNRSPFEGDYDIVTMLERVSTGTLYTVARGTQRIGELGIAPNGRLSAPEFFDVTDADDRTPNGAAFLTSPGPTVGVPE